MFNKKWIHRFNFWSSVFAISFFSIVTIYFLLTNVTISFFFYLNWFAWDAQDYGSLFVVWFIHLFLAFIFDTFYLSYFSNHSFYFYPLERQLRRIRYDFFMSPYEFPQLNIRGNDIFSLYPIRSDFFLFQRPAWESRTVFQIIYFAQTWIRICQFRIEAHRFWLNPLLSENFFFGSIENDSNSILTKSEMFLWHKFYNQLDVQSLNSNQEQIWKYRYWLYRYLPFHNQNETLLNMISLFKTTFSRSLLCESRITHNSWLQSAVFAENAVQCLFTRPTTSFLTKISHSQKFYEKWNESDFFFFLTRNCLNNFSIYDFSKIVSHTNLLCNNSKFGSRLPFIMKNIMELATYSETTPRIDFASENRIRIISFYQLSLRVRFFYNRTPLIIYNPTPLKLFELSNYFRNK